MIHLPGVLAAAGEVQSFCRRQGWHFCFILENVVQPRMDTDGHGYQAVARNRRLTQEVNENRSPKSVFIRVHPWLMIFSADSNRGI